jgi:hypothetical protein
MSEMARNKQALRSNIEKQHRSGGDLREAINGIFDRDAQINVVHPYNELTGPAEYIDRFLQPLEAAFEHLRRTDYIAFGSDCDGGDWWRREGNLLIKNWVFVDIPHVLLQMGYDLFANMTEEAV